MKELTLLSISVGAVIGVVMTAANVYLGLYAGLTVSASIPAAVMALAFYRGILKRDNILESNIVQTMASAGESLAAGVIFTIPALVIVGAWKDFAFWPTTLIAVLGGLLGVVFMIPLRKALIVEDKKLRYPEGVACAAVLKSASSDSKLGLRSVIQGILVGGSIKFLSSGLGILQGSVEWAAKLGKSVFFFGSDISPALIAVGYIIRLDIASLVFLGGAIGWIIAIPLMGIPPDLVGASALDISWSLWSTKIRYIGVGAMIVGGVWSIYSVRKGIASGLTGLKEAYTKKEDAVHATNRDLSLTVLMITFVVCFFGMFWLYDYLIQSFEYAILTTIIMFVAAFLFVAVSSYIVGLVGSSNNPVSGMTISALLGTAALFLVFGFKGDSAILATLGVAAVVCCAACTAGDCSQDLKTGSLVGASPRAQQIAQMLGVVIPAAVIAPTLSLLHHAYGIGTGLKAPQATLFASITNAFFGDGQLPVDMVIMGMIMGIIIIVIDSFLGRNDWKIRLHLMPLAVGIYLPVTLSVPIFIGGIIRYLVIRAKGDRPEGEDAGILASSGLIAGEALMGVLIAVFLYLNLNMKLDLIGKQTSEILSMFVIVGIAYFLHKLSVKKSV
ncbi:MAG: oligopeptide transporter, OPT family [Deltaproteobacteria bacterium CG11_big_fil_rev_8_21_14_0_20_45_16]|nr:MAG: oligopeptide transporter, OPT family [Deltaproteobacteria bacterium CG11_big_fil_rev_8_21_14_0_20_45_16]